MTDRVRSLTVALTHDMRTDDVEALIIAINQLKGVLSVASNITEPNDWCTERRVRDELLDKVWNVIKG